MFIRTISEGLPQPAPIAARLSQPCTRPGLATGTLGERCLPRALPILAQPDFQEHQSGREHRAGSDQGQPYELSGVTRCQSGAQGARDDERRG
jgi:hypothetical protein